MSAIATGPSARSPGLAVPAAAPRSGVALLVAALAALLASTCCVLPLAFVLVGISGAWIARLTSLQPYSIAFEALAAASLAFAGWRLFRPATCAMATPAARVWFWIIAALALLPVALALLAPLFY